MRVLVLGTYRDSELSRSHPLLETLAALHRQHGVTRIELTGLDDTGVIALMEAAAGHTLDDAATGSRPCPVPRDRRQPVLCERGPASSRPRPGPSPRIRRAGGCPTRVSKPWAFPRVCARSSVPGSGASEATPSECCLSRRSSVGTSTSMSWRGPRRPQRMSCSTSSKPRRPSPWCARWPTLLVATTSPTPSSSTPCMKTLVPTVGPGPIEWSPKP